MKTKRAYACVATLCLLSLSAAAQIYTPLYDLGINTSDPQNPQHAVFAQGRDGNIYSTAPDGGDYGFGAIFKITPAGKFTLLYSFQGLNGYGGGPTGGLTLGTDGALYGSTTNDPDDKTNPYVFKITTAGKLTILHQFNGTTEGDDPVIAPIQATDGNFYGTSSDGVSNYGTVYRMTPSGTMSVIYQFQSTPTNAYRYPGALIQGSDGNFYGTTGAQLLYKITPQGTIKELHTFTGPPDGYIPSGQLIQASDGSFYGVTQKGGTNNDGTIYKVSPSGVYSVVYNFPDTPYWPTGLVQGTDGNFYGGTWGGGAFSGGTLFQFNPTGTFTVVYDGFDYTLGTQPNSPLLQHTSGLFYSATEGNGTGTSCAGPSGCGVLYSFDMGLDPFVTFLPAQSSGTAGKSIGLLGQGFTGTTSVLFGGISATFKVVSDTYLTATVPTGAKTGFITLNTSGGTLTSNKKFRVR
jgi:uncharacterized repeat protein (TIGR03803 family)